VAGARAYSTPAGAAKVAICRLFRPPARGWKKRTRPWAAKSYRRHWFRLKRTCF